MEERKTDKRTLKTRKALCCGLAELLTVKELHRITVQEIADKADVNRVTFYKHYLDVYDLYEKLEKEVVTELGILVLEYGNDPEYIRHIVDYIDENHTIFSMVFSPYSTGTLRSKVEKTISGAQFSVAGEKYDVRKNRTEFEYICRYHSAGCISILEKWALSNYGQPKDFIIKTITEMENNFADYCSSGWKKA